MKISKPQVEQILKTLPIGYYIKRDVKVTLTDETASYYNNMYDCINISYPMIEQIADNIDVLEKDIRCLLYHEISHAFITPKNLHNSTIVNIFEDERIESLLRHFYRDVDFRNFVVKINNFTGQAPQSADDMFYQVVRFRVGPQQFVDEVHHIIMKYSKLDKFSKYYICNEYEDAIKELYDNICLYFSAKQSQQQNGQTQQQLNQNRNSMSDATSKNQIQDQSSQLQDVDDEEGNIDQANNILHSVYDKYISEDIEQDISGIFSNFKKMSKSNGSAINAYSGVFNPRSVVRDDYKYFIQQNRAGHIKAFAKMHLNLFIDCSGSFQDNDLTVNKLLKSLHNVEKTNHDFSFDLISCSKGQKLRAKNDRVQSSAGGTLLTEDIFEQFKRQQLPNTENINIVLYDGDAFQNEFNRYTKIRISHRFKAFDTNNTIVICDDENEAYLTQLHNCKVVITKNYAEELYKHVIMALKTLCK